MKDNKTAPPATNFWFGFSLGIGSAAVLGYFLGTKNGRETLKKLLEFAENFEGNLGDLIDSLEETKSDKQDQTPEEKITRTLESLPKLIEKIRNNADHSHKKIFIKEDKN